MKRYKKEKNNNHRHGEQYLQKTYLIKSHIQNIQDFLKFDNKETNNPVKVWLNT